MINVVKERPLFVPMTLWSYGCIYALFEMKPLRRYDYYTLLHLSIDLSTETVHGGNISLHIFCQTLSKVINKSQAILKPLYSKNNNVWDNFKTQLQALSRDCLVSKGHLISKANFLVFTWTKNPTKSLFDFCPSL